MMQKGQVNTFIILGLVLIILLILFYSIKQKETKVDEYVLEDVPTELLPVNQFITTCLEQTGEQAFSYIGERGGAYNLSVGNLPPTTQEAFNFFPNEDLAIPYWYYLENENDCTTCNFKVAYPPLKDQGTGSSIEEVVQKYIEANLPSCLNDLSSLEPQGFTLTSLGERTVNVNIKPSEVQVHLIMPTKIVKSDQTYELREFLTNIDLKFNRIYLLATEVLYDEITYRYLERFTYNILGSFSGTTKESLPSISDSTFDFGSTGTIWMKSKVQAKVQDLLASHIQALQAAGTANYQFRNFSDNPIKLKMYNSGSLITLDQDYRPLELYHFYLPFWEPYFDLNCNGEICMPESYSNTLFSFFGTQRYNFLYDISFPVIISIHDPTAFHNKGYTFRYALEVNLRNNEPLTTSLDDTASFLPGGTLFCDQNKRNSGKITVHVSDARTNKQIPDAQVFYSCSDDSCVIGNTDTAGNLISEFPLCLGGTISIHKDQYKPSHDFISTFLRKYESIDISVQPYKELQVDVQKMNIIKQDDAWIFVPRPFDLTEGESTLLTLKEKASSSYQVIEFNNTANVTIQLAPGEYDVSLFSFDKRTLLIPKEDREVGAFPLTKTVTIDPVLFNESNPYPAGGFEGSFSFGNEMYDAKTITFYYINYDLHSVPEDERRVEDLQNITLWQEYAKEYHDLMIPELR